MPYNEHVERTPEQEQQRIKRQRIAIVVWAVLLLIVLPFVIQEISESGKARRAFYAEVHELGKLGISMDSSGNGEFILGVNHEYGALGKLRQLSDARVLTERETEATYTAVVAALMSPLAPTAIFNSESLYLEGRWRSQVCFDHAHTVARRDWSAALGCLDTGLRLAKNGRRPADDVWTALLALLATATLTDQELATTLKWLETNEPKHTIATSMQHAATADFWFVEQLAKNELGPGWLRNPFRQRQWSTAAVLNHKAAVLKGMRHALRGSHTNPYEALRYRDSRGWYVPTSAPDEALYTLCLAETRYRMAYTATWLKLQKRTTGVWPTSLPADRRFVDGFANAPLRFSVDSDGIRVESVGLLPSEPIVARVKL